MARYLAAWCGARFGLALPSEAEGQGLVEYALILVLISIAAIAIMATIGGQVAALFAAVVAALGKVA